MRGNGGVFVTKRSASVWTTCKKNRDILDKISWLLPRRSSGGLSRRLPWRFQEYVARKKLSWRDTFGVRGRVGTTSGGISGGYHMQQYRSMDFSKHKRWLEIRPTSDQSHPMVVGGIWASLFNEGVALRKIRFVFFAFVYPPSTETPYQLVDCVPSGVHNHMQLAWLWIALFFPPLLRSGLR